MSIAYRSDIDGLRAFAVVSVILFHLGIVGFASGFVGVDVFFVISGYLITSIILRSLRQGTFSFKGFWERRVRRIIPAMFVVLLATTIAGYFISLYPTDFRSFGLTEAAQSVFLANVYFMRQTMYFAAPDDTIPLLHTWSLAVEEQFYIFFPFIIYFAFRWQKNRLPTIFGVLLGGSLLLDIFLTNLAPHASFVVPFLPHVWGGATNLSAGFYLFPARAWELLAGAVIATTSVSIKQKAVATGLAWSGFIGLCYSLTLLPAHTYFPGYIAIIPVAATASIIIAHASHRTFVYDLLSHPAFVWTGLISYSLYLWHWPFIVLGRQLALTGALSHINFSLFVIGGSFLLSIASYHLIEKPVRKRRVFTTQRRAYLAGALALVSLLVVGLYIYVSDGLPSRAPETAQAITHAVTDVNPRQGECFKNSVSKLLSHEAPCLMGTTAKTVGKNVDFVLWGDSHADASMPAFDALANKEHKVGAFFAVGGCSPLITPEPITTDEGCKDLKQRAITFINDHHVGTVYLVARWYDSYPFLNSKQAISLAHALQDTLAKLPPGQRVVIMKDVPPQPNFDSRAIFYHSLTKAFDINTLSISTATYHSLTDARNAEIDAVAAARPNTSVIDPTPIFCNTTSCPIQQHGHILYRDTSHITTTASLLLEPIIGL